MAPTDEMGKDSVLQQQLEHEREYVGRLYARLDELRQQKTEELERVRRTDIGSNHQSRSERDAFATHYEDRLAQLNAVDNRLVFGRLDGMFPDDERRYIGRIGLATENHQRLMVDWRAREAAAFYQATAHHPMGVCRRRHLVLDQRDVVDIEDEVLDPDVLDDQDVVQGEGALLAALNSQRTGRMTDIVSTIQAEQDRIIRAPLPGVMVVQGGPGTGKTAVALHRAAYLLYEHRERLRKSGVLIIGPSSSFLWYIDRVLPALGETGVVMSSVADLYPGVHGVSEPHRDVARIKSGLDMVDVIRQAVRDRQKVPAEDQVLQVDSHRVVLSRGIVRKARDKARATGKPHNEARATFVKIVLRELAEKLGQELNERSGNVTDRSYLIEDLRQAPEVRKAVNLCWLPLSAPTLIRHLFAKRQYLDSAFRNYSDQERDLLARDINSPLTISDVPLLDEAAELLGDVEQGDARTRFSDAEQARGAENAEKALHNMHQSLADVGVDGVVNSDDLLAFNAQPQHRMTAAEAAHSDRSWAYGHVVVDEAQELSPMQWRVVMRRCPMKSLTIVGDIAQAGSVSGAVSWSDALEPFVGQRFSLEELTVNYRTPAAIAHAAVSVAHAAGLQFSAPQAVREGHPPILEELPTGTDSHRVDEVALACAVEEIEIAAGGLVAVLAAESRVARLSELLEQRLPGRVGAGMRQVGYQAVVLSTWESKGLEFDAVVLVEPQQIIREDGGNGSLYVAMTRPTQRLRVIGCEPMPEGMYEPS